jgi:hypothetical protein
MARTSGSRPTTLPLEFELCGARSVIWFRAAIGNSPFLYRLDEGNRRFVMVGRCREFAYAIPNVFESPEKFLVRPLVLWAADLRHFQWS